MKTTWPSLKKKLIKDLNWVPCDSDGTPSSLSSMYLKSPTRGEVALYRGCLCFFENQWFKIKFKLPSVTLYDIEYSPNEKLLYWLDHKGRKVLALDIS